MVSPECNGDNVLHPRTIPSGLQQGPDLDILQSITTVVPPEDPTRVRAPRLNSLPNKALSIEPGALKNRRAPEAGRMAKFQTKLERSPRGALGATGAPPSGAGRR